jgi:hypothetical protein
MQAALPYSNYSSSDFLSADNVDFGYKSRLVLRHLICPNIRQLAVFKCGSLNLGSTHNICCRDLIFVLRLIRFKFDIFYQKTRHQLSLSQKRLNTSNKSNFPSCFKLKTYSVRQNWTYTSDLLCRCY